VPRFHLSFTQKIQRQTSIPIARKKIKMHIPNHERPLEETLPDYIDPNSAAAKPALSKEEIQTSTNIGNQLNPRAKCTFCGHEPHGACGKCT
jgi:hypothetical protein